MAFCDLLEKRISSSALMIVQRVAEEEDVAATTPVLKAGRAALPRGILCF